MKKMNKNIIFALAVMALVLCFSMGAAATTVAEADVTLDVQSAGAFALPYQTVTVNANLAEEYGYTDQLSPSEQVSALDVMVKMHELIYGDDFTTANCTDYLNVSADGWILKALEEASYNWSFILNGECAHSDVESSYGGYEGLTVNQTAVADGDICELVEYQDTTDYADQCLWFLQNNAKVTSLDVVAGSSIDLQLAGYPFATKGAYGTEAILAEHLSALSGVQLALMNEDGTLDDIPEAVTDKDGDVSLSFDDCGSYTLVATVPASSETKAFLSVLTVNVHQAVKASVYTDVQMAGAFTLPYQMVRVSSDLAESYGYVDSVPFWENVSALDVIVRAHQVAYGDAFNKEKCADYLEVSEYGGLKKGFEKATMNWAIAVNGECAHTDEEVSWGGYNGLALNQTPVVSGDVCELMEYQKSNATDHYIWLTQDDKRVDAVSVPVNKDITFSVGSFEFMTYGAYGTEAIIDDHLTALSGAQLAVMNQKGELTDIDDAVTDEDGNATISFTEEGAYTVVAYLPEESGDKAFMAVISVNAYIAKDAAKMTDLVPGAWYTESVSAMLSQGLMKGVSETRFDPNATLTRGMFATMLYRYAGSPNGGAAPFTDVAASAYYAAAVAWAYENEITNGVSATKFAPNDQITREQMATMILRFASVVGLDLPSGDGAALFDDDSAISPYAKASVYSLVKAGVIKGMGHNTFAPKETATRAQAAEIIYRLQNLK